MHHRLLTTLAGLALVGLSLTAADLPPAASGLVEFEKDVRPILEKNCLKCHGPDKQKGGLRLDSRTALLTGGNSGPAIVTGAKAAESRLLQAVAGVDPDLVMPPDGKSPLTAVEVGALRAWIEQGAKWTEAKSEKSEVRSQKSDHWAFQPVKRPDVPAKRNSPSTIRNPIDAFVLAKLDEKQLLQSPEADRPTLIRRVDARPDRPSADAGRSRGVRQRLDRRTLTTKLVDRLLASPHYGERWGRHWLDAARYADSDGFEKDTGRPCAWRYRDWVIDALNPDKPFDQFTIEQLAGDLLPKPTIEQKIATGFHRNTLTNKEGGVDKEQFRVEAVDGPGDHDR